MHIYESQTRKGTYEARINWSRAIAFNESNINYINDNIPDEKGVYCIYARGRVFDYEPEGFQNKKTNCVVYIGSGYVLTRIISHLTTPQNDLLAKYYDEMFLDFRFDRIGEYDDGVDWPRQVEASLLHLFEEKFGDIPAANKIRGQFQEIPDLKKMLITQTGEFNILRQG